MMKVLYLGDYVARTGFGTVSKNIIAELRKHFAEELQLDIIAINYFGEPYYEDKNTYVVSGKRNDVKEDDFGRHFLLKMLEISDYDGVFICQDLGVITPIIEIMDFVKKEKRKKNRKSFKSIYYFPVDCRLVEALTKDLEFFDILVTYTEYGRNEVLRFKPELKGKLKVIPHGNNPKDFYPLPAEEALRFRRGYFGANADKFIITNVNRNQPRKDIPNTIFGFIEAKNQWKNTPETPEPFLYLHMHPADPRGWDIRGIMLQTDLVEDVDYKLLPKEYEQSMADTETLNKIYNTSDAFLTTTLGEGWGMCTIFSTYITCSDCVKYIRDVKVGDKVLTNDGQYHRVLDTTKRKVNSYIYIKTVFGYFLKATHEHPYYVLSKERADWKRVDEIKKNDRLGIVKPVGNKPLPKFIDLSYYLPKNENDDWVVEEDFVSHKMGFSPKNVKWSYTYIIKKYKTTKKVAENARAFISGNKTNVSSVCLELANKLIEDGYVKPATNKVKRNIELNEDLLWLIGLYIADGSNEGGNRVEFSLNNTTKKLSAIRVKNIIKKIFGCDVIIKSQNHKLNVRISSKLVSNLFEKLCGKGALNKKVPDIFSESEKYLMPLIKGCWDGDGHVNLAIDRISLSTISATLAYQIQSILASNHILCSVAQKKIQNIGNYPSFICTIPSAYLERYLDSVKMNKINRKQKRTVSPEINARETDTHFFVKIKSIETINEEVDMYDLCVEESHSFVGNGLVCHNTYSEAAACRIPIIAPYSTSFIEMSGNGANAYMLKTLYPFCSPTDNVIREQTDIYEVAEMIHRVIIDRDSNFVVQSSKINRSYEWVNKLVWSEVCKHWIKYFKETF